MKAVLKLTIIGLSTALVYFIVGTKFTYTPQWTIDYLNPAAQSFLKMRLDIDPPGQTYDLIHFDEKWYMPWGILSALPFMPFQFLLGRFFPSIYITVLFSSINVMLVYLLIKQIRREFLTSISEIAVYVFLVLFALGTPHFYVGTLGSSWHIDQIVSLTFALAGLLFIFKKRRTKRDYFLSILCVAITLLGRATLVMWFVIPLYFYLLQHKFRFTFSYISNAVLIFSPLLVFTLLFFLYNYLRFGQLLEYGYAHITESPYLEARRREHGSFSIKHLIYNSWYFLFEIPSITLDDSKQKVSLGMNLKGNSIFAITPAFLAIFLSHIFFKIRNKLRIQHEVLMLWIASIITIVPSLMVYSTGWMQFGYRYALDITPFLLILTIFGMKGKINLLFILAVISSIAVHYLGITTLF